MHTAFTNFFGQLLEGHEPPPETFLDVQRRLRSQLVGELRRRGLWNAPPSFLGILGRDWRANGGEALAELSGRTLLYLLERLDFIDHGRRLGRPAESLVTHLLRQMITELQRRADPIGNRIFRHLREAISQAVEAGELQGLDGDEALRNNTILTFAADTLPELPEDDHDTQRLAEHVEGWVDALLPDLVTALGKRVTKVVAELRRRTVGLRHHGFQAFRFGDLIKPLQRGVRRRWQGVWSEHAGEMGFEGADDTSDQMAVPTLLVHPHNPIEHKSLDRCVTNGIGRHGAEARKESERLLRLWTFLRGSHPLLDPAPADRRGLAKKRLGELLDIPRARLDGLFGVLQQLAEICLQGIRPGSAEAITAATLGAGTPSNDDQGSPARAAEH